MPEYLSTSFRSEFMPTPTTEFWSYDLDDDSPNYDDGTKCTEVIAALLDVADLASDAVEKWAHYGVHSGPMHAAIDRLDLALNRAESRKLPQKSDGD